MKREAADICIVPIQPGDIDLLGQRMGANDDVDHRSYAGMQSRDEGVYLVAWDEDDPVGHLFIRWTENTEVPRIVDRYPQAAQFADCPEFVEVYVLPERRSQGIGTFTTSGVLIDEAGRERQWQNGPQVMLVRKLGDK